MFEPKIYYPNKSNPKSELYARLMKQCTDIGIEIIDTFPNDNELSKFNIFIDGIFGFSFKPPVRGEWEDRLKSINKISKDYKIPIVAIDIPSGCNVDQTDWQNNDLFLNAHMLISLSAPKLCAKNYKGIHYLGIFFNFLCFFLWFSLGDVTICVVL